jgi:hypothetical protein
LRVRARKQQSRDVRITRPGIGLFAGAGVLIGVATGIPTTGHAATTATWDRLAQCETHGDWSADYGNGLYGGLQLSMHTWQGYGGVSYAARPDLASRPDQITVAQRLADEAGWKPWPVCAHRLHLTNTDSMGRPDVAATPTPGPTSAATPQRPNPYHWPTDGF